MKKVITINLVGKSFLIEERGYKILERYLELARKSLKDNPDKEEIIKDLEQAIGEKFNTYIDKYKDTVLIKDVETVLSEMGSIDDESSSPDEKENGSIQPLKRLYRDSENAMIGGVCNGLGYYFGIDPSIIRIIFILLAFIGAGGVFIYIILWIVLPEAKTSSEKLQMKGDNVTFSALTDLINEKVDEVKQNSHNWQVAPKIILGIFIRIIEVILIFIGIAFVISGFIGFVVLTIILFYSLLNLPFFLNNVDSLMVLDKNYSNLIISLLYITLIIPIGAIFISGLEILYKKALVSEKLKIIFIIIWSIIFSLTISLFGKNIISSQRYDFNIDSSSIEIRSK